MRHLKTSSDFSIAEIEIDSKEYVSIDDLAKHTGISRQTISNRLSVLKKTKPGPGGSRLYPSEVAQYVVSDRALLGLEDSLTIRNDLMKHRLRELESILAPITSAHRLKKEVRNFVRETLAEQYEVAKAIRLKFNHK